MNEIRLAFFLTCQDLSSQLHDNYVLVLRLSVHCDCNYKTRSVFGNHCSSDRFDDDDFRRDAFLFGVVVKESLKHIDS